MAAGGDAGTAFLPGWVKPRRKSSSPAPQHLLFQRRKRARIGAHQPRRRPSEEKSLPWPCGSIPTWTPTPTPKSPRALTRINLASSSKDVEGIYARAAKLPQFAPARHPDAHRLAIDRSQALRTGCQESIAADAAGWPTVMGWSFSALAAGWASFISPPWPAVRPRGGNPPPPAAS